MLRHAEGLRQMYDKMRFAKKTYDKVAIKVTTKLRLSCFFVNCVSYLAAYFFVL